MKKYIVSAICILFVLLSCILLHAAEPRVVRVGAFNYFPAIFKDKDGVVKGFYVDALADISQRENIRFDYVYGSWAEGLERIKTGEVDVLVSVAFTEERAKFLDYASTPLLTVWAELYTTAASGIDGIFEMRNKRIAVMKNDYNAWNFINLVKSFHIACELVEMPDFDAVLKAVASKEADAGVVNSTFGAAKQKEYGLHSTGVVFNPFDIFFAVAKDKNQALLALLESNLADWRLQPDSLYDKARQKWLHRNDPITVIPRWVVAILIATGISALVAIAFVLVLKQQVKRKTLSLMESAEKYKILATRQDAILTSVPDIIMEVNTQRVYTWANVAGVAFFGDDVIGKEAAYYFEGEQEIYHKTRSLVEGSATVLYVESWQRRKDGEIRLLAWWCKALVDDQGTVTGVLSTARDITERKRAEEESAKLEARNRHLQKVESLGRMAGAIAHTFNNHLYVVTGSLELVLDDLPGDAEIRENLLQSMMAAQKAADVSRQMLTYLGQTSGEHDPIDLSKVCRQSLSLLEAAIPKGLILNVDFPDSGPVIRSNADQIQQILTHLITNAWESISNNQGSIGLTVRMVAHGDIPPSKRFPMDWQPQPVPHACLEVSDTGCGISNKDFEKLFDPFFTTKFPGRGMGLPVVKGIVKAQGGCITVDSEPGSGSVFRVYLPISTEKIPLPLEQEKPAAALVQKLETGGTVLLIEDEAMVRNTAKIMLTRLGYTVIEAQDGIEAMEIFQQRRNEICCVLSDLTMPGMGGWETLTALRRMRADVPVILASGHDRDVVMAGNHPDLPQAFLYKPYSKAMLKEALEKAMEAIQR